MRRFYWIYFSVCKSPYVSWSKEVENNRLQLNVCRRVLKNNLTAFRHNSVLYNDYISAVCLDVILLSVVVCQNGFLIPRYFISYVIKVWFFFLTSQSYRYLVGRAFSFHRRNFLTRSGISERKALNTLRSLLWRCELHWSKWQRRWIVKQLFFHTTSVTLSSKYVNNKITEGGCTDS